MSNGLGGVKLIPRACVCAAFILSAMCARVLIIYIFIGCARGCFYFFGRARGAFFLLDARGGAFILSVVRVVLFFIGRARGCFYFVCRTRRADMLRLLACAAPVACALVRCAPRKGDVHAWQWRRTFSLFWGALD